MKTGENVLISPQVTGRNKWTKAVIIETEKNPFVGIVITAKTKGGEIFFEKEDMFKKENSEQCTL